MLYQLKLEMLSGQRDGRRCQADDVGWFITRGIPWLLPLANAEYLEGGWVRS